MLEIPESQYAALREARSRVLRVRAGADTPEGLRGNLLGVGIGNKVKGTQTRDDISLRFYVGKKIPKGLLDENKAAAASLFTKPQAADSGSAEAPWFVPPNFEQVQTDVVEIGRARPYSGQLVLGSAISADSPRLRGIGAGAVGALVRDNGRFGLITCNHVIACNGWFPKGTKVMLMSFSGPQATPVVAAYDRCVPLRPGEPNEADCALAYLEPAISASGVPDGAKYTVTTPGTPAPRARVVKTGPATGTTTGEIVDLDAEILVDYEFGTYTLTRQLAIQGVDDKPFASDGDSGSIVFLDDGKRQEPLAMIWGGGRSLVFASPIQSCLTGLGPNVELFLEQVPVSSSPYQSV